MPPIAVALISLLPVMYASVFVHELGHVVCARLAGAVPTSFGMGVGRVFFACSFWGSRFFLGAKAPLTGLTFLLFPRLLPSKWATILAFSGGIVANALVGAIAFAVLKTWPKTTLLPYLWVVAGVNLLSAVGSAVPYRSRFGRTDGGLILNSFLGPTAVPPADTLRRVEALTDLLREVSDFRSLRVDLVSAADVWCDLGDPARARTLLDSAQAIDVEPFPAHGALEKVVLASIELAEGKLDQAQATCREAKQDLHRLNHEFGMLLADLVLVGVIQRCGGAQAISDLYGELAANPLVRDAKRLDQNLASRLLACQQGFSAGQGTEAVVAAYAATPARLRTTLTDLQTFRNAARSFTRLERYESAASAYASALKAVTALDETFRGPDRERFRNAQASLIIEAQNCLRRIGREDDAAKLAEFFPTDSDIEQKLIAAREKADKRWKKAMRWGQALTLLNVVVTAALIYFEPGSREIDRGSGDRVSVEMPEWMEAAAMAMGASLAFWTAIAIIFALPLAAASRWLHGLRRISATLTLIFAILPWLMGPAILIALVVFAGPHPMHRPSRSPRRQMPHQLRHQQPRPAADVQQHAVERQFQ